MRNVPGIQQEIDFGVRLMQQGIQRAVEHADSDYPGWSESAYRQFKIFLSNKPKGFKFMIEEFRGHVKGILPSPPSKRSFGAMAIRARKEKLIEKCGHGQVINPLAHRCFATIWMKL